MLDLALRLPLAMCKSPVTARSLLIDVPHRMRQVISTTPTAAADAIEQRTVNASYICMKDQVLCLSKSLPHLPKTLSLEAQPIRISASRPRFYSWA